MATLTTPILTTPLILLFLKMDGVRSQYKTRVSVESPYLKNKVPALQAVFQVINYTISNFL